jgi:hypothetical protein
MLETDKNVPDPLPMHVENSSVNLDDEVIRLLKHTSQNFNMTTTHVQKISALLSNKFSQNVCLLLKRQKFPLISLHSPAHD